jgi:hypothetical protein
LCAIYCIPHRIQPFNDGIGEQEEIKVAPAGDAEKIGKVAVPSAEVAGAPGYTSTAFLLSLQVIDIIAKQLDAGRPEGVPSEMYLANISPEYISRALEKSHAALTKEIVRGVQAMKEGTSSEGHTLNEKFCSSGSNFEFSYGTMQKFYGGLEGQIGIPNPDIFDTMRGEHMTTAPFTYWSPEEDSKERTTNPKKEWDYVVKAQAGDMAHEFPERKQDGEGRETDALVSLALFGRAAIGRGRSSRSSTSARWSLDHFVRHPKAVAAKLLKAEVVALRLYTGPMFKIYNTVLRDVENHRGQFVTTIHALNSAVLKLSKLQPACKVYRGVKGGILPQQFWQRNDHGVRGGIELAFMSTTTDREVALLYAQPNRAGQCSMVFEIQMGMIDRGAEISWVSQYPNEAEILFAPLTGLEMVGEPKVHSGKVLLIELRLNCNLHDLTIEEVIGKMKKTHLSLLEAMTQPYEVQQMPRHVQKRLLEHQQAMQAKDSEWFNDVVRVHFIVLHYSYYTVLILYTVLSTIM